MNALYYRVWHVWWVNSIHPKVPGPNCVPNFFSNLKKLICGLKTQIVTMINHIWKILHLYMWVHVPSDMLKCEEVKTQGEDWLTEWSTRKDFAPRPIRRGEDLIREVTELERSGGCPSVQAGEWAKTSWRIGKYPGKTHSATTDILLQSSL